jgi:gliding motility-associated lipoprotein GldH
MNRYTPDTKRIWLLLLPFLIGLQSCIQSPFYQKSYDLPGNKWRIDNRLTFTVDIVDTAIYYNMSLLLRHTNNYPYSNIWMKMAIKGPGDSVFRPVRIEVPLATPQGQWLGTGMGAIYEQRRMMVVDHNALPVTLDMISVSESSYNDIFSKRGVYEIRLEHNMREDALPDILQVGLRVEKSSKRQPAQQKPALQPAPVKDTIRSSAAPAS